MTDERRKGWIEFDKTVRQILDDNRESSKLLRQAREDQIRIGEALKSTDKKVEGITAGFDKLSDKIETITEQAIQARLGNEELRVRMERQEDATQTMVELVARHDAEINSLQKEDFMSKHGKAVFAIITIVVVGLIGLAGYNIQL